MVHDRYVVLTVDTIAPLRWPIAGVGRAASYAMRV